MNRKKGRKEMNVSVNPHFVSAPIFEVVDARFPLHLSQVLLQRPFSGGHVGLGCVEFSIDYGEHNNDSGGISY